MPEILEVTVDKFIFRIPTDRYYLEAGVWALAEASRIRIGLTDFLQQSGGDVAFADVQPVGSTVVFGDEVVTIETMKTDIILPSPVNGRVVEVNPAMETTPELINQAPYGEGWLAVIEADDWESDLSGLLTPQAYFDLVKEEAEEEMKRL